MGTREELIARVREGDAGALSEMLAASRPGLLRMVELRMDRGRRRRFEPEDVVQEALVEATRRLDEWRAQERYAFPLWLRLLTAQALAKAHRHHEQTQKRDAAREDALEPYGTSVSAFNAAAWLVSSATSPTEAARRTEVRERLAAALEALEPLDREILLLRHFEELSNADAAAELGIEPAAASKRFARALQRLRPLLRELSPDPSEEGP
ncbi:MAG TPA: sigma-70 family RNA polymerase sigma factor [Planctomycetota bacterium]|nr:sigma-70 family RNA polymerase sigma factor [Planctomycetota bacterium]